jgi:hypothetical protein
MKRILEVKKKIGTLSKNSKNPFFKSAYLDLNDLLNAVEPLLQEQGLVLLQPIIGNRVFTQIISTQEEETLSVEYNVLAESYLEIPSSITDPQKIGSCITYFRRYGLKSLLAIAEQDDDGNNASKPNPVVKEKLDDSKLDGCDKWGQKQKDAVIKKFDLTKEQLAKIK